MSVEPQTPLINIGMVDGDVPFWIRASVFMDYGQIYALDGRYFVKTTAPNGFFAAAFLEIRATWIIWDTGWSLAANISNHFDARLTMAFPLINEDERPVGVRCMNCNIYFAIGAQF